MKVFILSSLLFFSFASAVLAQGNKFHTSLQEWKEKRLQSLKQENGWLNLAGLFWLEEGKTSFGTGEQVKLRFPGSVLPGNAGYFERSGMQVTQVLNKDASVKVNGNMVATAVVFDTARGSQPVVSAGSLRWVLLKREDRIGIRLRDLAHPAIEALKQIPYFPVDTTWQIKARLVRPLIQTNIAITNVLGQTSMQLSPGKLYFEYKGKQYALDALQEGDELFIVFGDATSGKDSYPAGRFLYAAMPGNDGITILDFNRAINPPCAFTNYATCPLPPRQNVLDLVVNAGEKDPKILH